jgi:hypothetical protein
MRPRLSDAADPVATERTARRAIASYVTSNSQDLKEVSSEVSPQLGLCTQSSVWRRGLELDTASVEIRGGKDLAFAKFEVTSRGKETLGADPFLVVLRRESSRWRAFAICDDIYTLSDLPEILGLIRPHDGAAAPATSHPIWPADQALLSDSKRPLTWEVPEGEETVIAQVCQLMSEEFEADTRGESWPYTALAVCPGTPRDGSVPTNHYATGMPVRRCIWSIGVGGQMSASEVREYDFADYKQMRSPR